MKSGQCVYSFTAAMARKVIQQAGYSYSPQNKKGEITYGIIDGELSKRTENIIYNRNVIFNAEHMTHIE